MGMLFTGSTDQRENCIVKYPCTLKLLRKSLINFEAVFNYHTDKKNVASFYIDTQMFPVGHIYSINAQFKFNENACAVQCNCDQS